ncbi:xanthine dehydrogenase family protein molybdopterin-binding subunit [Parachitinimonas caeni]|uniref:Xanthine dehydrogenase family protein molybdopterin-binding subunit n=1 Tax=Parachitinimonas caeni TaxID=3031301 RepID=A0ABT7E139_9NEIS|nr:xanthine dehydrogenase family protein molybdopterin-binding subunit [Parachitinimonas caeni]MDK2125969.1 xanthine dehydrogenase family protein molybdopterin-binding subunit [Parachitinimonas caeni]
MSAELSRRDFLKASATVTGGLSLAFWLPGTAEAINTDQFKPNAFIKIEADNSVTVISKHLEMGQGVYTGLATIVAEELDADWSQIKIEGAPADARRYNNLHWGPAQGTGGSSSIANSYMQLRQAGATARAMLVSAAAEAWKVPAEAITVERGTLSHPPSGKKAKFGDFVSQALRQPVPEKVALKDPKDFKLIGKHAPRKDSRAKTTGRARYTQDVKMPGLQTALVIHPPRFGSKVKSFDASAAKPMKGVFDVVQIPSGIAVLAKDFWTAKQARDQVKVEWDDSNAMTQGTAELLAEYRELAKQDGLVAPGKRGDVDAALAKAAKVINAEFLFPYLAHAAMEPMNCVVKLSADQCEVWNGEQLHTGDQYALAQITGLKPEQIKINMLFAGGSFGRRANPVSDYVREAASIAKAIDGKAPVKLVWTREDDMRGGHYRPFYLHALSVGLDERGQPIAWKQRIVGQSIMAGTPFESFAVKNGIDSTSVEGAANLAYGIANLQVDLHSPKHAVPVQWWRSVGHTHTGFSTEVMIDMAAHAASLDPVAYRLALLQDHPRHSAVLKLAADKAGWTKPLAPGKAGEKRGRGVAVHESFNTVVAQVAEITVKADGSFKVDRVVCAVDCGVVINPDNVRAQMEGGIGFGLGAALHDAITLKAGAPEQSNFHDYPALRINEMPQIEVHIIPSTTNPTGVGEPGVPPIAPAVANALAAATGKRVFELPMGRG